ncbi:hypothetical protein PPBDW_I60034 [Photobacterium kishitanii]|nr:hypothetical protein PPBDW_I60034 [Photobacterium kishitanii]
MQRLNRGYLIKKTAHNLTDFTPKPTKYVIYITSFFTNSR